MKSYASRALVGTFVVALCAQSSAAAPAFCKPSLRLLPVGTIAFTVGKGTASCGGRRLAPPPVAPLSGELDNAAGTKIADLGLGCLAIGGGQNGALPPASIPDGSTSILDVSGVRGLTLTLAGSRGHGPADCTRGAGPGRHCANGSAGTNGSGACGSDGDCGAQSGACQLDAHCFFGPPLPVPAGPLSACALNAFAEDACGVAELNGNATLFVSLSTRLYLTSDPAAPCPQCVAGTCSAGKRAGLACGGGVGSKGTSLDCPPADAQFLGSLPLVLSPLTSAASVRTEPSGLFCPDQLNPGALGVPFARTIRQQGSPLLGGPNLFGLTVAGSFCVPPSGSGLVDGVLDLPGPGTVSVTGTAAVCLLGLLCL